MALLTEPWNTKKYSTFFHVFFSCLRQRHVFLVDFFLVETRYYITTTINCVQVEFGCFGLVKGPVRNQRTL